MRRVSIQKLHRRTQGQGMIETALLLPILMLLAFNAINFGYFFFVAVNLTAAPRNSVQYSIIGAATPSAPVMAQAGPASNTASVSYVAYQDVAGSLKGYSTATVQVCTKANGINASYQALCCQTSGSGSTCGMNGTAAPHDPEYNAVTGTSPFVLHQVTINYTITPIIPSFTIPTPAGRIPLTLLPNLTVHRKVLMRSMD